MQPGDERRIKERAPKTISCDYHVTGAKDRASMYSDRLELMTSESYSKLVKSQNLTCLDPRVRANTFLRLQTKKHPDQRSFHNNSWNKSSGQTPPRD